MRRSLAPYRLLGRLHYVKCSPPSICHTPHKARSKNVHRNCCVEGICATRFISCSCLSPCSFASSPSSPPLRPRSFASLACATFDIKLKKKRSLSCLESTIRAGSNSSYTKESKGRGRLGRPNQSPSLPNQVQWASAELPKRNRRRANEMSKNASRKMGPFVFQVWDHLPGRERQVKK
jgi:hypothetical protein